MAKNLLLSKLKGYLSLEGLLVLAIAIAVLLRLLNLGSREFWYDEVLSLLLSTGQRDAYQAPEALPVVLGDYTTLLSLPAESGLADVFHTLKSLLKSLLEGEPHPPLLFLSQHFWLRLLGNSEAATRSLGALLSIGAIGSAYGLGRVLLGHRSGLLLAALLGTNPFYLFHSLNVRMYGPLVLWTTLSAWALLSLVYQPNENRSTHHRLLWSVLLAVSVAAGLLTFYLFAYWVMALAVLVLYCDRRHWWQHGIRLGAGVLLTLPWALWGTVRQLRNTDIQRFSNHKGIVAGGLKHLQDLAQTLGTHLVMGDWVTSLPTNSATLAGLVAIGLLLSGIFTLWQQGKRQTLVIVLLLGLFPLLLAFIVDVLAGKFTLGFGWGRTMIFVLPGCLLLLALWVEQAGDRWREPVAALVLFLYLSLSIGDFSLRQRQVFHQIASLIQQAPTTPTLIAMNSQAWGHVMRLAYYIPSTAPVMLLTQEPDQLAGALRRALATQPSHYTRILWLDSARPVWSPASTENDKQQVQEVLESQFKLFTTQELVGTMQLDQFTAKLYINPNT